MGIFSSVNHGHETHEELANCVGRNDDHVGASAGLSAAGVIILIGETVTSAPVLMEQATAAVTVGCLGYAAIRGARGHGEQQQYRAALIEREVANR